MDIKILGSGCANCQRLEAATHEVVDQLGIEANFQKVTDVAEIASWGVMHTPALVVDDVVVMSGRVPSTAQLRELLAR